MNITIPAGTEFRASVLGYYDYLYPDSSSTYISQESCLARRVSGNKITSSNEDWVPIVVDNQATIKQHGSPIWVKKCILKHY